MKKLINFLLIFLFISTQVLAADLEKFQKNINKSPHVKKTEWIKDAVFLILMNPGVETSEFQTALVRICKLSKKYSFDKLEVQFARKKGKVLISRKCKY